jgi:two-component sensor histidine kinase
MELEASIDVRLQPTPDAPARARQRLWELNGALSPARAGEARLLVSELVTNALMHAPP